MPDAADGPAMYAHLRSLALGQTAASLGLDVPLGPPVVFGAVMDWSSEDWTATLAAFVTGDVSLYLSHGGGIIGGGAHADVLQAGIDFVGFAGAHLAEMQPATEFPRPPAESCRFFALTSQGVFVADETVEALSSGASPLADLGGAGQKALYLLRTTEQASSNA